MVMSVCGRKKSPLIGFIYCNCNSRHMAPIQEEAEPAGVWQDGGGLGLVSGN